MVDKELEMSADELIEYIKTNVVEFDKIYLAYNRVSASGDFLGIDTNDVRGKKFCGIMIALDGGVISDTIEVDLEEYKDDLIEFSHYPKDESKESIYVEIL